MYRTPVLARYHAHLLFFQTFSYQSWIPQYQFIFCSRITNGSIPPHQPHFSIAPEPQHISFPAAPSQRDPQIPPNHLQSPPPSANTLNTGAPNASPLQPRRQQLESLRHLLVPPVLRLPPDLRPDGDLPPLLQQARAQDDAVLAERELVVVRVRGAVRAVVAVHRLACVRGQSPRMCGGKGRGGSGEVGEGKKGGCTHRRRRSRCTSSARRRP